MMKLVKCFVRVRVGASAAKPKKPKSRDNCRAINLVTADKVINPIESGSIVTVTIFTER